MREKQLRREMAVQASVSSEAEPSQKTDTEETMNRKVPTKVTPMLPDSSSTASTSASLHSALPTSKPPLRKLSLKPKAASALNTQTASGSSDAAVPSTSAQQPEPESSSPSLNGSSSDAKGTALSFIHDYSTHAHSLIVHSCLFSSFYMHSKYLHFASSQYEQRLIDRDGTLKQTKRP